MRLHTLSILAQIVAVRVSITSEKKVSMDSYVLAKLSLSYPCDMNSVDESIWVYCM